MATTLKLRMRDTEGTAQVVDTTAAGLTEAYASFEAVKTVAIGGAAWTAAILDTLEVGVVNAAVDAEITEKCTAVYASVLYTAPPALTYGWEPTVPYPAREPNEVVAY